jgi:hypothetical protein
MLSECIKAWITKQPMRECRKKSEVNSSVTVIGIVIDIGHHQDRDSHVHVRIL